MSRTEKHFRPYADRNHAIWKKQANRIVRRSMDQINSGSQYKKINEIWDSPREI